jgi:hypothetical protein
MRDRAFIWGGISQLGDVNVEEEPYRSELARDNIVVFDLTKLGTNGGSVHDKGFDDITEVMMLIEQKLPRDQQLAPPDQAHVR